MYYSLCICKLAYLVIKFVTNIINKGFLWSILSYFLNYFCFVVAICDLADNVKTMHGLCKLLIACGNFF